MSYPASIEKALAYLQTKDIPKGYRKHPWFYRWLWKKGIEIPPPLLSGFFTNMLIFGLICGFVTALTIFLLMERNTWSFPADFLLRWATLGIATGLGGAFGIRRTQKKLKLLSWQEVQNLPIKTDNPDV